MRTEQKSRTLPGLISARRWLSLLLMTAAICFAPPAALVSAAQTAEAETETAETETTETKTPEKESAAEDAEADTSTDKQEEAPKEKSENPEKPEKKQEPPADSEKKSGPKEESKPKESKPKEEPAAEKETSEPAKDTDAKDTDARDTDANDKDANDKDTEAKGDAKEMKSDENEKPAEEADPPAEKKVEPKPEPPKPDSKPPVTPEHPKKKKCIIGSTAVLLEKQSEIQFRARVDTGAKSCSLHVEKIKIEDESKKENITERMTENIGKVIHFEVQNGNNKTHILTSKIAGYVIIKTSDKKEGKRRYKVPLTFRWKSMEKEILVTLNNRKHMQYPLLLGRNFLKGDFLVDVELNSDD